MSFDGELLDQYAMIPIVTGQIRELGRDSVIGEIVQTWASWPKYIQDIHLRNRAVTLMDRASAEREIAKAKETIRAQKRLELERKAKKLRVVESSAKAEVAALESEYVKLSDRASAAGEVAEAAEDAVKAFDADPDALPPDRDDVAKAEAAEKEEPAEPVIEQHERDRWRALLDRESYAELQKMAKERGLKAGKINRADLLASLVDAYAAEELGKRRDAYLAGMIGDAFEDPGDKQPEPPEDDIDESSLDEGPEDMAEDQNQDGDDSSDE
jgi:hypothetical protein